MRTLMLSYNMLRHVGLMNGHVLLHINQERPKGIELI